ncbi:YczE/YyaS/YitT family protein [Sporolactobacillus pectinivorans]|uniref:YczE/YyaS/YitT family protein n=1 Tax=Sporolactobacillus pectinivorans TaxID=1591408 RepID=UPI001EFE25EE|nr:hypothetical protein [Sporolactobacillus pectinivorans]
MAKGLVWLLVSVLLNAFGNALTVKAALGSAPWTAASLNLSSAFGITVGQALIIVGFIVLVVDDFLRGRRSLLKDFFNFLYVLTFGYMIDAWLLLMQHLAMNGFILRVAVCVLGIMCIGCALSIYFRVNLVLHPFDDLMKILREKFFHGNVVLAQRVSLGIPLAVGLSIGLVRHQLIGISVGTAVSFLCMGYFILMFDKILKLHLDRKWRFRLSAQRHGHHVHGVLHAHSKA